MQIGELKTSIQSKIEPCYILSGNLGYLQTKAMAILDALADGMTRDFNYSRFSGGGSLNEIVAALNTPPIMSQCRLVVWENGVSNSAVAQLGAAVDAFKGYLKSPLPTTVLIIVDKDEKCKTLYKNAMVVNCGKIDKLDLYKDAEEIIKSQDLRADYSIIKELVERCNGDLSILGSEVSKLKHVVSGSAITLNDIDFCLPRSVAAKIYELSDAVIKRQSERAYTITVDLLNRGFEPTVLLSKLTEYYRNAFYTKISRDGEDVVASKLRIHAYTFKLLKDTIRQYTPMELKAVLDRLESLEHIMKSTNINNRDALLNMVCRLANKE